MSEIEDSETEECILINKVSCEELIFIHPTFENAGILKTEIGI